MSVTLQPCSWTLTTELAGTDVKGRPEVFDQDGLHGLQPCSLLEPTGKAVLKCLITLDITMITGVAAWRRDGKEFSIDAAGIGGRLSRSAIVIRGEKFWVPEKRPKHAHGLIPVGKRGARPLCT